METRQICRFDLLPLYDQSTLVPHALSPSQSRNYRHYVHFSYVYVYISNNKHNDGRFSYRKKQRQTAQLHSPNTDDDASYIFFSILCLGSARAVGSSPCVPVCVCVRTVRWSPAHRQNTPRNVDYSVQLFCRRIVVPNSVDFRLCVRACWPPFACRMYSRRRVDRTRGLWHTRDPATKRPSASAHTSPHSWTLQNCTFLCEYIPRTPHKHTHASRWSVQSCREQ